MIHEYLLPYMWRPRRTNTLVVEIKIMHTMVSWNIRVWTKDWGLIEHISWLLFHAHITPVVTNIFFMFDIVFDIRHNISIMLINVKSIWFTSPADRNLLQDAVYSWQLYMNCTIEISLIQSINHHDIFINDFKTRSFTHRGWVTRICFDIINHNWFI